MKKICLALALAGGFIIPMSSQAQFADAVLSYNSGTGFATGFTNPNAALGAPASGASVTPFSPPFSQSQIVSIGAGGEITLQMDSPIINDPNDPYGINFQIFANQFFTESKTGTVTGLFDHAATITVQVSPDDVNWYTLNPSLAPQPGTLYPTDGGGNPQIPVNPALTLANFTGQNLAGIRSLYNGSAGGTGYDLAWAQDGSGDSVNLPSADYVQIDVQSGVLDLDAVSLVAPEPPTWALMAGGIAVLGLVLKTNIRRLAWAACAFCFLAAVSTARAATFIENFSTNPLQDGWQVFGDTNLFAWDSANNVLDVTWDSSQQNSYFYHPLGTILAIEDSFTVEFDLQLNNATATGAFELAVGLFNYGEATNADFSRPLADTPNLFEFDYFPDGGYGPSIDATLADMTVSATDDNDFYFAYDDSQSLNTGVLYHVILTHDASSPAISGEVLTGGLVFSSLPNVFSGPITDFRLDTLSISSYSDADDPYGDSIFAQGTVGNITVTLPPPPIQNLAGSLANGRWTMQLNSQTNWLYTLQRTGDFQTWTNVSDPAPGNGATLYLFDNSPPHDRGFYRVSAARP
jgi:hypothetical protein